MAYRQKHLLCLILGPAAMTLQPGGTGTPAPKALLGEDLHAELQKAPKGPKCQLFPI